jgi:alpha-L-rhamnosidase
MRCRAASLSAAVTLTACWSAGGEPQVAGAAAVRAVRLRTEDRRDPLGIDRRAPRLSWALEAIDPRRRLLRQTAFEVRVASTPDRLVTSPDLWQPGPLTSPATHVAYAGVPLASRTACCWQVRVRDQDGRTSPWSEVATWTMGLLEADDWRGSWIGLGGVPSPPLAGLPWIWSAEAEPPPAAPPGRRCLRTAFALPDRAVAKATLWINADDRFEAFVNGEPAGADAEYDTVTAHDVAALLQPGRNCLAVAATNDHAAANPAGLVARLRVELDDGSAVERTTADAWRVSAAPAPGWTAADFDDSSWPDARAAEPLPEAWRESARRVPPAPEPWLRRSFVLEAPPRRALAYVASLGYHELWINGARAGDAVLAPSVSDLGKRVRYATYDVTDLLAPGANAIGLWLGAGWGRFARYGRAKAPLARAQLEIEDAEGRMIVPTDGDWLAAPSSITPIGGWRFGDYGGEHHDGARETLPWSEPAFDASGFEPATEHHLAVALCAEACEPNRHQEEIAPVAVEARAGGCRIDFGRCFTGWVELPLSGEPGTTVTVEVSEREDQPRSYGQVYRYTLGPRGEGVLRPRFNYLAGRWLTVTGAVPPPRARVRGHLVHTDFEPTTRFRCSDPLLQQVHDVAEWTLRCVALGGYLVDCPHRERWGYGGDAHATMGPALTHFDVRAFYGKWLEDWRDVQGGDGDVPPTAPTHEGGGGPAWSGICVTLPWEVYVHGGEVGVLRENYGTMRRWLQFAAGKERDGLLQKYGHPDWGFCGDWVPPGRGQGKGERVDERSTLFFNNAYYAHALATAAKVARVLGEADDAAAFTAAAQRVRSAAHAEFYDPAAATYANGEQPYLALALFAGVTPEDQRERVEASLARALAGKEWHVDTGIHGTYFLLEQLCAMDRSDAIARLVRQRDYPSWGHMLAQGATTFWEQWDGVNSRMHSSFLSVGAWFVRGLAGLRPDPERPGFTHFFVQPQVIADLDEVDLVHDAPCGRIECRWKRGPLHLELEVVVPPGAEATVAVPTAAPQQVTEGGRPAREAPGVRAVDPARGVYRVGSGRYRFRAPPPRGE